MIYKIIIKLIILSGRQNKNKENTFNGFLAYKKGVW